MRLVKLLYLEFTAFMMFFFLFGSCIFYFPMLYDTANKETEDKRTSMLLWNIICYGALLLYLIVLERQYIRHKAIKSSYQDITIEFSRLEVRSKEL